MEQILTLRHNFVKRISGKLLRGTCPFAGEATLSTMRLPPLSRGEYFKRKEFTPWETNSKTESSLKEDLFQKGLCVRESKQTVTKVVTNSFNCVHSPEMPQKQMNELLLDDAFKQINLVL